MWTTLLAVALGAAPSGASTWDCVGRPQLPQDGVQYESELGYAQLGQQGKDPTQTAQEEALNLLVDRIGLPCPELRARATIWRVGRGKDQACAMAVLESSAVQACAQSINAQDVTPALVKIAEQVAKDFPPPKGKPLAAVIDQILQDGFVAGARSVWLANQMRIAISQHGKIELHPRPPATTWSGAGLPPGVQVVLNADVVELQEGRRKMLDVTWTAIGKGGSGAVVEKAYQAVRVNAFAAPAPPLSRVPSLKSDPKLQVRIDAAAGGTLCPGETTHLVVKSDEDLYVQVWDLYGENGALLIFPNPDHADAMVHANKPLEISPTSGFQALPIRGYDAERFLVVGARRKQDLAWAENFRGYCKLSPSDTNKVTDATSYAGMVRLSATGFRIADDPRCKSIALPPGMNLNQLLDTLAKEISETPLCGAQ